MHFSTQLRIPTMPPYTRLWLWRWQ